MSRTFRVFISDPHAIFRVGIKKIVASIPGFTIAGETDSVSKLQELITQTQPDLLLIYTIPIKAGIDATVLLLKEFPLLKIALLTNTACHPDLHLAIARGVAGIIHKAIGEKELIHGFEVLKKGLPFYSQEVMPYLLKRQPFLKGDSGDYKKEDWTEREISILKYICKGHDNAMISRLMSLKCRTIEGHKSRMIEKACVPNTVNLVLFAIKNKLISLRDL